MEGKKEAISKPKTTRDDIRFPTTKERKNHQRFVCVLQISCSFSFPLVVGGRNYDLLTAAGPENYLRGTGRDGSFSGPRRLFHNLYLATARSDRWLITSHKKMHLFILGKLSTVSPWAVAVNYEKIERQRWAVRNIWPTAHMEGNNREPRNIIHWSLGVLLPSVSSHLCLGFGYIIKHSVQIPDDESRPGPRHIFLSLLAVGHSFHHLRLFPGGHRDYVWNLRWWPSREKMKSQMNES